MLCSWKDQVLARMGCVKGSLELDPSVHGVGHGRVEITQPAAGRGQGGATIAVRVLFYALSTRAARRQ